MPQATSAALNWVEQGLVPDHAVRFGIRRLLQQRLTELRAGDPEATVVLAQEFLAAMRQSPLAVLPEKANEQHYEVPAAFFGQVLGPHRKYSACWWPEGVTTLAQAEAAALQATCERAGLADGQDVLELGCGWGSLSLWMARRHPRSRITAVSNSHSQRAYIEERARHEGLRNLEVITCDFNDFAPVERFDRVVSIEMFEHLRNWPLAFERVARWLRPDGRFFLHVFAHRDAPYLFEDRDASDWMTRHFFAGGIMPSDDLPLACQDHLRVLDRWRWSGVHYQRTAAAWLANMDARREQLLPLLAATYGSPDAQLWWNRWRLFFLSVEELFGWNGGRQWWVSHTLLAPR
jgi:cyclopropane-fatty-acyl-phospholipid synthase